jgi:hypothetical protein
MSPTRRIAQRPRKLKHYKTSTPNRLRVVLEELHLRLRRPPDIGLQPPVLPTLSRHGPARIYRAELRSIADTKAT